MRFGFKANRGNAALVALCLARALCGAEEPAGIRERFLNRIKAELSLEPDFVCTQNIERFYRNAADQAWQKADTLRFDVAFAGDRELYSLPGARGFQSTAPAALAHHGTLSTGQFALIARHVFLTSAAQFTYQGETEQNGRGAYEYSYDVPADHSSYHLRSNTAEAVVAFQGSFWIERDSLDLIRLEVQPYDVPEALRLAETETALNYSRIAIDGVDISLPVDAALTVTAADGLSSLNRIRLSGCRHYRAESTIRFATQGAASASEADRLMAPGLSLPPGALLELTLASALDPATARPGDTVRATLAHPIRSGETILVPQGVPVIGRVVHLDRTTTPFPVYVVGLQFDAVEMEGGSIPLAATMVDAGPAAGLLRQSKHLDAAFTGKRKTRTDMLVREVERGQGVLDWDARRAPIPRGLRMKWRVQGEGLPPLEDSKTPGIERQHR